MDRKKLRIAAVGDIHVKESSGGNYANLFLEISEKADILVLCGDLTDHGLQTEAEVLAHELQSLRIPVIGVLGNHDYENDQADEVKNILRSAKLFMVDEEEFEINGVGFVGVKGFGGGFGKYTLNPFGEPAMKAFVQETVNEALKLESLLARLTINKKVVIMHYSPIEETIVSEPASIHPFLGSSRFEEPINRYEPDVVFHGHSDYGKLSGKTTKGIPVFNVALPLLKSQTPKQSYKIFEL